MASMPQPVVLHAGEVAGRWYGIACAGERLVATSAGSTRATTLETLRKSLPPGVGHRVAETNAGFAEKTLALLAELEAGREEHKQYELASDLLGEIRSVILKVSAAVPLGYVTSYGNIARASGADARDVGQLMATNPLYPIVACHRVVGSDLALVGYTGSKSPAALRAKLARLSKESRGFRAEQDVEVEGRKLRVYPVEWALAKAAKLEDRQRPLFE